MLTVITGCMHSGKTLEMIIRARANARCATYVMPMLNRQRTRDLEKLYGISLVFVRSLSEVENVPLCENVYIDEGNFFEANDLPALEQLIDGGHNVTISMLRKDRFNEPYNEFTNWCMLNADEIIVKHAAWCDVPGCKAEGFNSAIEGETGGSGPKNVVDANNVRYLVLCKEHWRAYRGGKLTQEQPQSEMGLA